jgi:hypothetical protein
MSLTLLLAVRNMATRLSWLGIALACPALCLGSGLTNGHYVIKAYYAAVCLAGDLPISVGHTMSDSDLNATIDASGQVTGTINVRGLKASTTGSFHFQNGLGTLQLQTIDQGNGLEATQIQGQLQGTQIVGTATSSHGTTSAVLDVSTVGPLNVIFEFDATVDTQGHLTGSGTATSCGVHVPINVTGNNGATNCSLHFVGTNLPGFTWDASGPPDDAGFIASWNGNGFGVSSAGDELLIFAPTTPLTPHVVSRKYHGQTRNFDINLPLSGNQGLECRSGGTTGDYQLVFSFADSIHVSGGVTAIGTSAQPRSTIVGSTVIVNLTGVTNAQTIEVTLHGVSDGTNTADVTVPMSILAGDVNGDGVVDATDLAQTQSQSGQPVTEANFREDVTTNGLINSSDISFVQTRSGTRLPTAPVATATPAATVSPPPGHTAKVRRHKRIR